MRVAVNGAAALILVSASAFLTGCGGESAQSSIDRATQELRIGNDQAALIDLKHAVEKAPKNPRARLLLGEAELRLGNPLAAGQEVENARRAGAPSEAAAELEARIELAQGKANQLLIELASSPLSETVRATYRGRALLQLGKYPEAEQAFRSALALKPATAEAQTGLAEALSADGQLDQATQELASVLSVRPNSADAWRVRAVISHHRGQYADMQAALERAVSFAPGQLDLRDQAMLLIYLADVRLRLGDIHGAEAAYRDLPAAAREAPLARMLAGKIAQANKDYATAADNFRAVVSQTPKNPLARDLLGRALLAKGDLEGAADQFAAVDAGSPNYVSARKFLAAIRLRNGFAAGAEFTLLPLADANRSDAEFGLLLSSAQVRAGHESAAIRTLEQTLQAKPENVDLQLQLASLYLSVGFTGKALERLDQLAAENEKDPNTLNRAGLLLMSKGELQQAKVMLAKAMAMDPHNETTALAQAGLAVRQGDKAVARLRLQTMCSENPKAIRPRLMLAELELSEGREPEASQAIQEILTISAGNADMLDALGRIYVETHHNDEAIAEFRAALALAPRNLNFWLHLSTAQLAAGRPTEAGEAASKALDVAPDSRPAIRAAVQAELRANHSDAALKRVSTASAAHPDDALLWELTGDVRSARKEFSVAQTAYDRASHINPSGTLAFKSFQARHAGGLARECEPLEHWVSEHPADADARGLLATAYESAGRPADAMREYETTLSHNPRHLLALNNLAWLYLKATDPRALATAERAYAVAPNSSTIADTYGWALLQSGQAATGVKVLQHAASDNTNGAIQIHYATALVRTGDRENARRILTQVVAGNFRESDRSQAEHLLRDL